MSSSWNALIRDETGTTAIEYSLLASLAAIACIAGLRAFAESTISLYTTITTAMGLS